MARAEILKVPGLGVRLHTLMKRKRVTQTDLAQRHVASRQTLHRAISSDEITEQTALALAEALGVPIEEILVREDRTHSAVRERLPDSRHGRYYPQSVRVWLQEFRLELTKAGATEDEVEEAMELLTAPQVFTFYAGAQRGQDYTEDEILTAMHALAVPIRAELKKRGRKIR